MQTTKANRSKYPKKGCPPIRQLFSKIKIPLCKMLTNQGKTADKPGETKTGELEAGDE